MTKITNKVVERYALSYWDITCIYLVNHPIVVKPKEFFKKINDWSRFYYIQLRSIDSITNEEKIALADILNLALVENFIESVKHNDKYLCSAVKALAAFQYLQSIGIATPTIDEQGEIITVHEMVEAGVLKLTNK